MGGWNRSRYVTGHRDRSAGASRPPPPPPPPDYGDGHYPVPLWEREFCRHVGDITWESFCENKQYVGTFHKHEPWDDSEAFNCFQNAKARFWAHYHGKPSDIPLLDDPDLYIDKVDHQCKLDPELIAELDSVGLPFEEDNSAPATGWPNAGANNKCTQNGSGNWDVFIEKKVEVNKWEPEANLAPDTTWGDQANAVTPEAVWGGQSSNEWGNNSNTSWGAPLEKPSWQSWSKNQYTSNNWNNNFHGGSSNDRYQQPEDPSYTSRIEGTAATQTPSEGFHRCSLRGDHEHQPHVRAGSRLVTEEPLDQLPSRLGHSTSPTTSGPSGQESWGSTSSSRGPIMDSW